jgi:hypothetical protein
LAQLRADALVIAPDAFFISKSDQLGALTARHAVPAITQFREFAAGGGLMSYGGSFTEAARLVGIYTGRILKGEKPTDRPVGRSDHKGGVDHQSQDRQGTRTDCAAIAAFTRRRGDRMRRRLPVMALSRPDRLT